MEVVEGRPNGGEGAAVPWVEPKRGDEPIVGEENQSEAKRWARWVPRSSFVRTYWRRFGSRGAP